MFERIAANMVEVPAGAPPVRQACALTGNSVSSVILPAFNASNTTANVISLVMFAGSSGSSGAREYRMLPVPTSISTTCGAVT